jgi:hypothetical protein
LCVHSERINPEKIMDVSINGYVTNFTRVYPQKKVWVRGSNKGFQVYIDGDKVGEPMTRAQLEEAGRSLRAPAPRPMPFATAKLGDMARLR